MSRSNPPPPSEPRIPPDDEYNDALLANVRPKAWANPTPSERYNLVVLGGGTAGLVAALGARGLGAKVALVEKHLMGGDCLNFGCVPSKALLAAAKAAYAPRRAERLGVRGTLEPDFAEVMRHLRRTRADISQHDSAARLSGLGVDVYLGEGRFTAPDAIVVGDQTLRFARAVIATGARPHFPNIAGLAAVECLTNETVFSLERAPARLIVIGSGPIGCELGQAFQRLGSRVTLISDSPLLPGDDPDAQTVLRQQFEREGIRLVLAAQIRSIEAHASEKRVELEIGGDRQRVVADTILLATGRRPNIEGLGLEQAKVGFGENGVSVDDHLRTTNRRIYAAGDVCSHQRLTHAADAMARIVIKNALFFGRDKLSALCVPHCTYTDPEVAHVGISHAEAARRGSGVLTLTQPLARVDRAALEGEDQGFARVYVDPKRGRILGATMVARHAGDMISEMTLALNAGLSLSALGSTIHPYPTRAEAWKKLGDAYNRTRLTPRVHAWFERYFRWWR